MNFKVGDWVRNKIFINEKEQVVDIIRDTADSLNFIYFNNDRIALELDYELWQPKEGEFVIPKIINGKAGTYISGFEVCMWTNDDVYDCEPFIGTLPTFLKEK